MLRAAGPCYSTAPTHQWEKPQALWSDRLPISFFSIYSLTYMSQNKAKKIKTLFVIVPLLYILYDQLLQSISDTQDQMLIYCITLKLPFQWKQTLSIPPSHINHGCQEFLYTYTSLWRGCFQTTENVLRMRA